MLLWYFFLMVRHPPRSTLFPYTTLFRSKNAEGEELSITHVQFDVLKATELEAALDASQDLEREREGTAWLWFSRSEEHTSELQSLTNLVCRLLLEKKKRTHAGKPTANDR